MSHTERRRSCSALQQYCQSYSPHFRRTSPVPGRFCDIKKSSHAVFKAVMGCWIERILELRREDRGMYIRYEYSTASDIIGRSKAARKFGGLKDQIGGRGCVRRL